MFVRFVQLTQFTTKWRKLGLDDEDLRILEISLVGNALSGVVIPGTGGLRKLRFGPPSWHSGKRGGTRVIYAFIVEGKAVYLFTVYGKNEQKDMSAEERRVFRGILAQVHKKHASEQD